MPPISISPFSTSMYSVTGPLASVHDCRVQLPATRPRNESGDGVGVGTSVGDGEANGVGDAPVDGLAAALRLGPGIGSFRISGRIVITAAAIAPAAPMSATTIRVFTPGDIGSVMRPPSGRGRDGEGWSARDARPLAGSSHPATSLTMGSQARPRSVYGPTISR